MYLNIRVISLGEQLVNLRARLLFMERRRIVSSFIWRRQTVLWESDLKEEEMVGPRKFNSSSKELDVENLLKLKLQLQSFPKTVFERWLDGFRIMVSI